VAIGDRQRAVVERSRRAVGLAEGMGLDHVHAEASVALRATPIAPLAAGQSSAAAVPWLMCPPWARRAEFRHRVAGPGLGPSGMSAVDQCLHCEKRVFTREDG
jgi:hypothetical protein